MENKIYKRKNITDPEELKKFDYASHRYCSYIGFIKYQQKKYPEKDIKSEWKRSDFINKFMNTGIDPYDKTELILRYGLRNLPFATKKELAEESQRGTVMLNGPIGHIEN